MKLAFVLKQFVKMGVQNIFLPLVYRLYKKKKIDPKLVLFADAHHRELPPSMRCLYEELRKTELHPVVMVSDYGRDPFTKNLRQMIRFMKAYANAGYVVICDNFLPAASCKKRQETTVIQLWHACGALKKFGYDAPEDIPSYYRGNVLKNCDVVTVSSRWCVSRFASAMRLPAERVLPLGISRTDRYYRADAASRVREQFYREYPQARGRRILLWAPTFRGCPAMPTICGEEAIDRLGSRLGEGWIVIKRLHPHLMPRNAAESRLSTEELLFVTDLLITDYSSILFDYLIFRRPLVRFAPDLAEYEEHRGFYMDYRTLPGALVTDEKELFDAVTREASRFDRQAIEAAFRKYMDACDGHATQRLIELMTRQRPVS